mgnify:CR=1 FL=1
MRTMGADCGFNNNEDLGLLIKIESGDIIYVSDKSIDLYEGSNKLNVICDILPIEINGKKMEFLSDIKSGIDYSKGELLQNEKIFVIKIIRDDNTKQLFNHSLLDTEITIFFFALNNTGIVLIENLFLYQKAIIKNYRNGIWL